MRDKLAITRALVAQSDLWTVEAAMKHWWQDVRDDSGLRLTISGYDAFKFLTIDQHEFDFSRVLSPSLLMTLNKKLDCPYYIKVGKTPKLIIFGSQQAIMYAMYGDLEKFLRYLNRT